MTPAAVSPSGLLLAGLDRLLGPVLGATPAPEPPAVTGPGLVGFLVTIALVAACIPLFLSMTRKVRGVSFRDERSPGADGPGAGAAAAVADSPDTPGTATAADDRP